MTEAIQNIEITEDEPDTSSWLESELLASLKESLPQGENSSFTLTARDPKQKVVGGVIAGTSYGWLLVKVLWVEASHRKLGLGRILMNRAEQKATQSGCHGAWLDTSNPDAMAFYHKLGYEEFGKLQNIDNQRPTNHSRWFMQKSLIT